MKITEADLDMACEELPMLEFFPRDSRAAVMKLLATMCPHREALRWLVNELVNRVNKWPGPAEVRGLLCTRYDPLDGIDRWCSIPGYTAQEAEARHYEQHEQLKSGGYIAEEARGMLKTLTGGVKDLARIQRTAIPFPSSTPKKSA